MRPPLSTCASTLGIVAVLFLGTTAAHAQTTDAARTAAAQALFDQGTKLMAERKFDEACPKLAEAARLEATKVGVKLQLAECYEGAGMLASAWTTYRQAEAAAAAANQPDRVTYAREHAEAVGKRSSRLTIAVPPSLQFAPGLVVKRDGLDIGAALWGVPVPVDRGTHIVVATATGKRRWVETRQMKAEGDVVTVTVGPLADEGSAQRPAAVAPVPVPGTIPLPKTVESPMLAAPSDATPPPAISRRTVGFVVGGVGLVGLGVGAFFGVKSMSKKSDGDAECKLAGGTCTDAGMALRDDAITAGTLSTVGFVAGGVAMAAGVVLVLTAPESGASVVAMQMAPGGVEVVGRW